MTTRHTFNKLLKRAIIDAYRNFASIKLQSNDVTKHIDFANTVINGKRQNADALFTYIRNTVVLPTWVNKGTIHNLLRRAVGKGSTIEAASIEAIKMFSDWTPIANLYGSSIIQAIARRSKYEEVKVIPTFPYSDPVKQSGALAQVLAKVAKPKTVKKVVVVKVPTTTSEIIEYAIANTTFTATELLTKKFTIVEFFDRIGIKIQA